MYEDRLKKFTSIFYKLAALYGNSEVFANFVKMSAIAIYNSFAKNNEMEQEYLRVINSYKKDYQPLFSEMFGELILMYEEAGEITDILGHFYEKEHLSNGHLGQFFTPSHISDFMAEIAIGSQNTLQKIIEKNGFITMSEPTCGAGRNDIILC